VRMNLSAKEETGARVRLTGGRGGGGVSGQILWRGGGSQRSSCSNGVEGEEGSGEAATGWSRRRGGKGGDKNGVRHFFLRWLGGAGQKGRGKGGSVRGCHAAEEEGKREGGRCGVDS
jgi:hypothetical protein